MRTRTFVLSLVLHVLLVGGFMVTRIMAATELPDPPRAITFMIVRPELPDVPAPPARANPSPTPAVNPNAAPVEEPEFLRPELPDRPDDSLLRADVVFGAGGDRSEERRVGKECRAGGRRLLQHKDGGVMQL